MKPKKNQIFIGEKNKRKIAKEIINDCHSELESNLLSFEFITEKTLQRYLIKTYKEACFVSSLTKVLHINFSDSHPLNEIQIIHYGAICEAILGSIFKTNSALSQYKPKDKIGKLVELGIISTNLENDIRTLWDIRNNIHLHKAKDTNEKFFKKHLTNKKDIIVELCESIESYFNNPI
jgi:hypothetical protein